MKGFSKYLLLQDPRPKRFVCLVDKGSGRWAVEKIGTNRDQVKDKFDALRKQRINARFETWK